MDSTRRTYRITLRRVAMMAALAALLIPAGSAGAATRYRQPVVTSVSPTKATIGETLTIRGRYFVRGKGRNSVVFRRDGARAVFVKSDVSTTKMLKVVIPDRLAPFLLVRDGIPQLTRFRVRILARRFGRRFTSTTRSPLIGPRKPPAPPIPPKAAADGDCDGDNILNGVDGDDDNDLLADATEVEFKLDPCNRDTEGDGVEDGYELQSARDLNDDRYQSPNGFLPYPDKKPYSNPLFADAKSDYDGDGLELVDEFRLWLRYGKRSLEAMNYSDGKQYSLDVATVGYPNQAAFLARAAQLGYSEDKLLNMNSGVVPGFTDDPKRRDLDAYWWGPIDELYKGDTAVTDVERYYYDINYDGKLSDDERDEDSDGLSNWVESHGFMQPGWWTHVYQKERPYVLSFSGTDLTDPDSDGDGILDGADDQDHDDLPNVRELRRQLVAGEVPSGADTACVFGADSYVAFRIGVDNPDRICWHRPQEGTADDPMDDGPWRAWVQPFNPCLPDPRSRTCERYPNLGALYPPFHADTPMFNVFDGTLANPE